MKKKSFEIALAAVSCAIATLFVAVLGINTSFAFLLGYVIGAVALMLPLSKRFWWGSVMAYIATCLLCLAFNGIPLFYKLFPFVAFFGLHPLANALQQKFKVNRWIAFVVKDVWFVGMLCGAWALFNAMTEVSLPYAWMYDWAYPIIVVIGSLLFVFYDWLMFRSQKLVDYYVLRIERGKGNTNIPPSAPIQEDKTFDVFSEMSEKTAEEEKKETEENAKKGEKDDQ